MSSEHWVTDPTMPIKLKIAAKGFGSIAPRTVIEQFNATVAKHGNRSALGVKVPTAADPAKKVTKT